MRKIKIAAGILLIAHIMLANCMAGYAAEVEQHQGYYLLYTYDQENGADLEVGINQAITDQTHEEIDLDNLILFPLEAGVYHPFQMEQLAAEELTKEVREYLLYAGYAQIEDEAAAESYELEAQEHAKTNGLGGWKEQEKVPEEGEAQGAEKKPGADELQKKENKNEGGELSENKHEGGKTKKEKASGHKGKHTEREGIGFWTKLSRELWVDASKYVRIVVVVFGIVILMGAAIIIRLITQVNYWTRIACRLYDTSKRRKE